MPDRPFMIYPKSFDSFSAASLTLQSGAVDDEFPMENLQTEDLEVPAVFDATLTTQIDAGIAAKTDSWRGFALVDIVGASPDFEFRLSALTGGAWDSGWIKPFPTDTQDDERWARNAYWVIPPAGGPTAANLQDDYSIEFRDTTTSSATLSIGRIVAGDVYEAPHNFAQAWTRTRKDLSLSQRTLRGQRRFKRKATYREDAFDMAFIQDAEREPILRWLEARLGNSLPAVFMPYPDVPSTHWLYASYGAFVHGPFTTEFVDAAAKRFVFEEIVAA